MTKILTNRSTNVRGLIEDVAGLAAICLLLTAGLYLPAFT